MPDADLAFASLTVIGGKLRSGELSSVELTRFFLDRLEKHGSKYNCVVTITRELALKEAAKADQELKSGRDRGPLHGIPYGGKDPLATKGIPTTWGCASYKDRVIDHDATVVKKLREAGAVLAAKLSMVEVAGGMGYRQANASLTGPGLNPWKPSQWSGGSSSGTGSAVAAGLVPFGIGTETWGSITTPSSYCGLSGLRPTYGRVSRAGAMALSWTLDKIGPMTHSAHDCGLVLDAIAGPDPDDPSTTERPYKYPPADAPGRPWKLAVLKDGVKNAQPEVKENFERALKVFEPLGTIDEIEVPDSPFGTVASMILAAEMASAFEEMVSSGEVAHRARGQDRRVRETGRARHRLSPRPAHPGEALPRARRLVRPVRRRPHGADRRCGTHGFRLLRRPVRQQITRRSRQRVRHAGDRPPHRSDERRPPHRAPARRPGLFRESPARPRRRVPERDSVAPRASRRDLTATNRQMNER